MPEIAAAQTAADMTYAKPHAFMPTGGSNRRAARVQAGALGPELAAQLKTHGLALRHFDCEAYSAVCSDVLMLKVAVISNKQLSKFLNFSLALSH